MDRSLDNHSVYLAMHYLKERQYYKTLHWLESESGLYCDIDYVQNMINAGEWDKVESYLGGFKIRVGEDDAAESMAILYEIKNQHLVEALQQERDEEALFILTKQMVGLESFFNKANMANVLLKDKAGRDQYFGKHTDIVTSRDRLGVKVREMIEKHPRLAEKCRFSEFGGSRLSFLGNQSLEWQHSKCQNKTPAVQYTSLLEDHRCKTPNPVLAQVLSPNLKAPLIRGSQQPHNVVPAVTANLPLMAHTRVGPTLTALHAGAPAFALQDGQAVSSLVNNLPKDVVSSTNMGSVVTCLDFNPMHEDVLAIGTMTGVSFLWRIGSKFWDTRINFIPRKRACYSPALGAAFINGQNVHVTRVVWSPAGDHLGVAFSMALVRIYSYKYRETTVLTFDKEAHEGIVTDLAFFIQNKKLFIVTCGHDALIKIYAADGDIVSTFKAPASVASICVLQKQHLHVLYAADSLGRLMAWRMAGGSASECFTLNMPGCSFSEVRCKSSRLFSSGFNQEKHPLVREWAYTEDNVALSLKSEYLGVGGGDATNFFFDSDGKIVTVGFDWCVKFWEIDRAHPLHVTTTNGGLPGHPIVRLSKHGSFLAVSALENGLKVLGNIKGRLLANSNLTAGASAKSYSSENIRKPNTLSSNVASFSAAGASMGFNSSTVLNARPTFLNQQVDSDDSEMKVMGMTKEINVPSQMRSLRLSSDSPYQISRLLYSKTGGVLVALTSTASHKVWRWGAGKATPSLEPEIVRISMDNETTSLRTENPVACLAISNDSEFVLSASGGRVSIFKLSSFKREESIIAPPPVATCLMFDPRDNNTIAVGLSDASVQIYDARQNKVLKTLRGHRKQVTGLAYFIDLKILISSGADDKLCVWNLETWDNNTNKFLELPEGRTNTPRAAGTRLHSNNDHTRLLVVHETHVATHHPATLDRFFKWHQPPVRGLITDAVFSCDGKSIFVSILDGSVCVLEACQPLLKCRINYSAYLPSNRSTLNVPPMAIAAHPCNPHQIALGLSDGGVYILEPLESDGWGTDPLASTCDKEA